MLKEKIRALMLEKGWDQKRLAHEAGITEACLSYILSGRTQTPYTGTLVSLAAALGTTLDYLLSGRPPDEQLEDVS